VRGTWKEGCNTEDSERHTKEGSGKAALLLQGCIKGDLRHLARESLVNMSIGPESVFDILSVMNNLKVCGLIFEHHPLRDIFLWAHVS
jgi:hypothetical protein